MPKLLETKKHVIGKTLITYINPAFVAVIVVDLTEAKVVMANNPNQFYITLEEAEQLLSLMRE